MLSKRDIERELGKGISIYPLHTKNIKENSINFTIGQNAWALGSGSVIEDTQKTFVLAQSGKVGAKHHIKKGEKATLWKGKKLFLVLLPHATTIVETSEVIAVGNRIGGTLQSKVGMVAQGIGAIGTMLGPNFCGHLMISLHNISDEVVVLPVGDTFISIVFHYLDTPSRESHNSNMSGHVDKLAELGVHIDRGTREFLTEDWKCSFEGIRTKMCESEEFKNYKKQLSKHKYSILAEYISLRNILILAALCFIIVAFGMVAYYADSKSNSNIWSGRYWTVIITGIIVPMIISTKKLFRKR